MKILVPTDFSQFAKAAFKTAVLLAKKLNAEVHLYHSAAIPDNWEDLPVEQKYKDEVNKVIAIAARDRMEEMSKSAKEKGVKVEYHYTGGKFLKNIEEITDKIDFDLVVMGSHGASGIQEWLIGSNTQKVIRKLHKNVLVVKNEVEEINFSKVLFATGLNVEEQHIFRKLLDFLKPFEVEELHVMAVDTFSFFNQPSIVMQEALKDFKEIAKDYNCQTHFYSNYSVEAGIRHFSEDNDIKLVAMSNHTRRPIKRMFQGSNVELVANHMKIPVLSLDHTD